MHACVMQQTDRQTHWLAETNGKRPQLTSKTECCSEEHSMYFHSPRSKPEDGTNNTDYKTMKKSRNYKN